MGRRRKHKPKGEAPVREPAVPERISSPFADAFEGLQVPDKPEPTPKPAAPAPVPPSPPEDGYAYEDRVALGNAYLGVAPIDHERPEPARRVPHEQRDADLPDDEDELARARLAALVADGVRFDVKRDEDGRVEALRLGTDPGALKSLRGGKLDAEAEIDLHGLSSDQARARLVRSVRDAQARGVRLLRVVHGKGIHSQGGVPVLRDVVVRCLSEGAATPFVLAFVTCAPAHGGLGALLVRLSR